jgi:hypothetical protein
MWFVMRREGMRSLKRRWMDGEKERDDFCVI